MKSSSSIVLMVAICALLFPTAHQMNAGQSEYSRSSDGVLRIKHSPVLGINIPITVWINGALEGPFAKGHIFERSLAPGRHTIYATRPSRPSQAYYGTLEVQPGETYSFVVKCTPNQVHLVPVGRVD
jgi:hypothetical protein